MASFSYNPESAFREDLASVLEEHDLVLETFQITDKPKLGETVREIRVKASRSLDVQQTKLDLNKS